MPISPQEMYSNIETREKRAVEFLYQQFTVGEAKEYSAKRLATDIGITKDRAQYTTRTLVDLGILGRTVEFHYAPNRTAIGKFAEWTLLVPQAEAERLLSENRHDRLVKTEAAMRSGALKGGQARTKEALTIKRAKRIAEVEATIPAEPSPPTRAEARDLIVAARSYQNRTSKFEEKLAQMEALAKEIGVTFSYDRVMEASSLETDPVLEAIVLVLPEVDRLEAALEKAWGQMAAQARTASITTQIASTH